MSACIDMKHDEMTWTEYQRGHLACKELQKVCFSIVVTNENFGTARHTLDTIRLTINKILRGCWLNTPPPLSMQRWSPGSDKLVPFHQPCLFSARGLHASRDCM